MNAKDKPHAPDREKIRDILADARLLPAARLAAVELYYHTDWGTGELYAKRAIAAHIRRNIGVSEPTAKRIKRKLTELGYIKDDFFYPVAPSRKPTGEELTHDPVTHDPVTHDPVTHDPVTHDPVTHDRSPMTPYPVTHDLPPGHPRPTPRSPVTPITSSTSSSLPSPSSDPRRPDTREGSLEGERERLESSRRAQAEEERRRREQYNAEVRAILNTY